MEKTKTKSINQWLNDCNTITKIFFFYLTSSLREQARDFVFLSLLTHLVMFSKIDFFGLRLWSIDENRITKNAFRRKISNSKWFLIGIDCMICIVIAVENAFEMSTSSRPTTQIWWNSNLCFSFGFAKSKKENNWKSFTCNALLG